MSLAETLAAPPLPSKTPARTVALTVGLFLAACVLSLLVGYLNAPYFDALNRVFHARSALSRGLLFSSYLFLLSTLVIVWRPQRFGFQIGDSLRQWRPTVIVTLVFSALVALVLSQMPRTPFSGADAIIEVIVIPFTEEPFFRGVLFTVLLWVLSRMYPAQRAMTLTVIFSGIAFGLAHLNNIFYYQVPFVMLQVLNAIVMGLVGGYLRARTNSIYPAIFLHGVINLVAVLF